MHGMAALRACPTGLAVCPRRSHLRVSPLPLGGRGSNDLKTSMSRAAAPNLPYGQKIRAQKDDFGWPSDLDPDDDKPMTKEQFDKFRALLKEHSELDKRIESTALSLDLCMVVRDGVTLASAIMDSAVLKLDKENEISLHTTKQTLVMYVSIFVNLADMTYHKRFDVESVFSLLGALRGLGAISYILLQDAMANPNYNKTTLLSHNFVNEIDDARSEFLKKMDILEGRFRAFQNSTKVCELLRNIMFDAKTLTMFFVYKIVTKRDMLLGIDSGDKRRRVITSASDDDEPDARGENSSNFA